MAIDDYEPLRRILTEELAETAFRGSRLRDALFRRTARRVPRRAACSNRGSAAGRSAANSAGPFEHEAAPRLLRAAVHRVARPVRRRRREYASAPTRSVTRHCM